jgi:hypothetical protein
VISVNVRKMSPATAEALPYRATIVTREDGKLLGVRVLRARTDTDLDRKIEQLRGANAQDDLAQLERGPAPRGGQGPRGNPKG